MKLLILGLLSLASAHDPPCPTITSRTSVCSTCIQPMCMAISTVTPVCGCPEEVATAYTEFPCVEGGEDGSGCPGGCAGTEWVTATATACEGAPTGCDAK